jgi:hypothetical protein
MCPFSAVGGTVVSSGLRFCALNPVKLCSPQSRRKRNGAARRCVLGFACRRFGPTETEWEKRGRHVLARVIHRQTFGDMLPNVNFSSYHCRSSCARRAKIVPVWVFPLSVSLAQPAMDPGRRWGRWPLAPLWFTSFLSTTAFFRENHVSYNAHMPRWASFVPIHSFFSAFDREVPR